MKKIGPAASSRTRNARRAQPWPTALVRAQVRSLGLTVWVHFWVGYGYGFDCLRLCGLCVALCLGLCLSAMRWSQCAYLCARRQPEARNVHGNKQRWMQSFLWNFQNIKYTHLSTSISNFNALTLILSSLHTKCSWVQATIVRQCVTCHAASSKLTWGISMQCLDTSRESKRCIACLSGDEPSWRYFRLRFLSPHFISCPSPKPFATWPVGHTHTHARTRTHTHTGIASANMP